MEKHISDYTGETILTMSIPSTATPDPGVQRANFYPVDRYDMTTTKVLSNVPWHHPVRLMENLKRAKDEGRREAMLTAAERAEDYPKFRLVEGLFNVGQGFACISLPVEVMKGEDGRIEVKYLATLACIIHSRFNFDPPSGMPGLWEMLSSRGQEIF